MLTVKVERHSGQLKSQNDITKRMHNVVLQGRKTSGRASLAADLVLKPEMIRTEMG